MKLKKYFFAVFIILSSLLLAVFLVWGILKASQSIKSVLKNKIEESQSQFKSYEYIITPGETFSGLAASLGLSVKQVSEILAASDKVYNLASIREGNAIRIFFDLETNQFQKLEYQINENNLLVVEFQEGELTAKQIEIEYEIKLTRASGIIEKSLYETAKNLGLVDKTIIELADIFAWDIDFGFDVRRGDGFDLLYEKRFLKGEEVGPGKILIARYKAQDKIHWAIYYKDTEGREDYYDLEGNCLRRQFLRSPLQYKYISSGFSYQRMHPILGRYTQHLAIDYAAPAGTPISATGAGTITFVGWQGGVGKTVIIRHNETYTTRYSHLSNYAKGIKYGARVAQVQIIGFIGSTGYLSTGPHLEYAMTKYGKLINPLIQKFDTVKPIGDLYREDFDSRKQELLKLFD